MEDAETSIMVDPRAAPSAADQGAHSLSRNGEPPCGWNSSTSPRRWA
jgi:hypothetical protein